MALHSDPLGEDALLVRCPSPAGAVALAARLRVLAPPWLRDAVPAYATLGVHFDADRTTAGKVQSFLAGLPPSPAVESAGCEHLIEVAYDGPDLAEACGRLGLSVAELVAEHTSASYPVQAVGFVPGFAYLGPVAARLSGLPRLGTPRARVPAGSVALMGTHTAVYPVECPGGWPLIGRTAARLVGDDAADILLSPGDRVRFIPVSPGA